MTFKEFMDKVLNAFPQAEVNEDNDGQLVIYTNLRIDPQALRDTQLAAGSDPDTYSDLYNSAPVVPFED